LVRNERRENEYVIMFHHHNAGRNTTWKTANKSFETLIKFSYLQTAVTHQDRILEVKSRLNAGNANGS